MPYMLKMGFCIFLIITALLLWQKKKKKPTKLKLTAYKDEKNKLSGLKKVSAEVVDDETFQHEGIFVYKAKKHSAYEVLSVPLGAPVYEIKRAFAEKTNLDPSNKELYFNAYKALTLKN